VNSIVTGGAWVGVVNRLDTRGMNLQARCHGDSLRAGKSKWQVGYRVSLYRH